MLRPKEPGREDPSGMASENEHSVLNPKYSIDNLREAFQSKKRGNLGNGPNRGGGGSSKNQKSPKFQLGKVQN